MRRDEDGYIVVETVMSFTLLVFLMVSILSLINIVTVQARVHYAMTETAKTVSMYCYGLEKIGFANPIMEGQKRAEKAEGEIKTFKENLKGVLDAVDDFSNANPGDFEKTFEAGKSLAEAGKGFWEQGQNLADSDPKELLQDFMNYGIDEIGSQGFQWLLRKLMIRYLANDQMDGDTYLKSYGVTKGIDGLTFAVVDTFDLNAEKNTDSKLLTKDGDVRIIVTYEIDYTFGALPLPFHKIKVTQEVITKAWLNGAGTGYSK